MLPAMRLLFNQNSTFLVINFLNRVYIIGSLGYERTLLQYGQNVEETMFGRVVFDVDEQLLFRNTGEGILDSAAVSMIGLQYLPTMVYQMGQRPTYSPVVLAFKAATVARWWLSSPVLERRRGSSVIGGSSLCNGVSTHTHTHTQTSR